MANSYKVKGLKQTEKALELLGKNATKKVLKGALRDSTRPVIKEARARTPRNTGDLRRSIAAKLDKYGNAMVGYRLGKKYKGFVGLFIEKGTKGHKIGLSKKDIRNGRKAIKTPFGFKRSAEVRGLKPNPILGPALEASHAKAVAIFKKRAYERTILETIAQAGKYK